MLRAVVPCGEQLAPVSFHGRIVQELVLVRIAALDAHVLDAVRKRQEARLVVAEGNALRGAFVQVEGVAFRGSESGERGKQREDAE